MTLVKINHDLVSRLEARVSVPLRMACKRSLQHTQYPPADRPAETGQPRTGSPRRSRRLPGDPHQLPPIGLGERESVVNTNALRVHRPYAPVPRPSGLPPVRPQGQHINRVKVPVGVSHNVVAESNCVIAKWGGEQLEAKGQSAG